MGGCGCGCGMKKEPVRHAPGCKCTPEKHCGCFDGKPCACGGE